MSDSCTSSGCASSSCESPASQPPARWRQVLSDRVIAALLIAIIALALFDQAQALASLAFTAEALWGMLPFFLLALAVAAYAKASGADALIARAFSGHPVKTVVMAALVGAFSPFCSCGVIPLIAALLSAGVPLAPVMAFWIASPIMDPEMFVLTAAGIGFEFALAKTVATVGMGLMAGFAAYGLERMGWLRNPLAASSGCGSGCAPSLEQARPVWAFWHDPARMEAFRGEALSVGGFLGKWLTVAFFIESLMLAWLPAESIASTVGGSEWYVIPMSSLVGVPAYLNGYAAIPLVGGLMEMGMAPGAAMAFITAGAVSSIPAAIAVHALVRKPVFFTYVVLGLIGSMLSGMSYQMFINAS